MMKSVSKLENNQTPGIPTKNPKLILLIGKVGTGKTEFIKRTVLPKFANHFVIDFCDEYLDVANDKKAVPLQTNSWEQPQSDDDTFFKSLLIDKDLVVFEHIPLGLGLWYNKRKIFLNLLLTRRHFGGYANVIMVSQNIKIDRYILSFVTDVICFDEVSEADVKENSQDAWSFNMISASKNEIDSTFGLKLLIDKQ